jgi:phosphate uptake regulator
MVKRKAISMAGKTIVVSLPSTWVKKYGINKGDELDINEQYRRVIVSTDKLIKGEKTKLDVSGSEIIAKRSIDALFKRGYDEVEVIYNDKKELAEIKQALKLTSTTFMMVEENKNSLTLKSIANISQDDFDPVLRRMMIQFKQMNNELLNAIKENDDEKIKEVKELELENNKHTHFLRRAINKGAYSDYRTITTMYTFLEQIENIADEWKFLCLHLENKKPKPTKEVIKVFEEVNDYTKLFYNVFYKHKKEDIELFTRQRKELITKLLNLFEEQDKENAWIVHYLINITQQQFTLLGPVMAIKSGTL